MSCPECNQDYEYGWCKPCNSNHFQNDFNNWTSGNDKTNKFIRDAQLNANSNRKVIEWIPYDRFKDVKQIGKGGFGTIHYARWIDGPIKEWDIENQQWERWVGIEDEDEEEDDDDDDDDEEEDNDDDDEEEDKDKVEDDDGLEVALKKFDNFVNFNDVLNEVNSLSNI